MADFIDKLVVRAYAPKRRAMFLGVGIPLVLLVLYGVFELGRYDAHFRVVESVRGALVANARIRALEAENARQRTQLEAADVARRVDREGYKQVERSLGDMQSQIYRLNQDLSFYRGLVQPDSLVHVKVQQMQIVPEPPISGAGAGAVPGAVAARGAGSRLAAPAQGPEYRLKFVLMQTGKPDSVVAGTATVAIDGLQQGKPLSLSFAEVSRNHRVSLAYSFRYFEDYDELIQLPPGFEPTRVGVEIHSGKDLSRGFRQAFVWKAQGMSVETEANGGEAPKGGVDVQAETE